MCFSEKRIVLVDLQSKVQVLALEALSKARVQLYGPQLVPEPDKVQHGRHL